MKLRNTFIFLLIISMVLLILLFYFTNTSLQRQYNLLLKSTQGIGFLPRTEGRVFPEKFVYLVQTEKCLPGLLMQFEYLLNYTECQCHVIVYSFKENCTNNTYKHIEHVFEPNNISTWNTGRNLLFKIARERQESYLYYIFMDDDIQLGYNTDIIPDSLMLRSPLRYFETFLIERNPGIGIVDYAFHHGSNFILDKIWNNCNVIDKLTSLPLNRTSLLSLYLTAVHFDALFNAFHRDIVDHLLPYTVEYDDNSWHHSQRYLVSLIELKFRGQAVMFTPVTVINTLHREYPQNNTSILDDWRKIMPTIVSTMPDKYQNHFSDIIKQHLDNPINYTDNSHTMCYMLPPKNSFGMYSHFELDWSID